MSDWLPRTCSVPRVPFTGAGKGCSEGPPAKSLHLQAHTACSASAHLAVATQSSSRPGQKYKEIQRTGTHGEEGDGEGVRHWSRLLVWEGRKSLSKILCPALEPMAREG